MDAFLMMMMMVEKRGYMGALQRLYIAESRSQSPHNNSARICRPHVIHKRLRSDRLCEIAGLNFHKPD